MPEIKRNFTGGKMNKDLDERLVPPGEYRDAQNIQVSTSDESDVGTVQNILGNTAGCTYSGTSTNPIPDGSKTIGSISDEKNDTLYWLVAGPNFNACDNLPLAVGDTVSFKDMIMGNRYIAHTQDSTCFPTFVDKYKFCVGVQSSLAGIQNTLTLDDTSLYDQIFPGTTVTGFIGCTQSFQANVNYVGQINTLPLNYQSTSTTVTTQNVINTQALRVRALINTNCHSNPNDYNFYETRAGWAYGSGNSSSACCPNYGATSGVLSNLPDCDNSQFWLHPNDYDPNMVVGSILSNVTDINSQGCPLNGLCGSTAEILDVQFQSICADSENINSPGYSGMAYPYFEMIMTSCFNAYVFTIGYNGSTSGQNARWFERSSLTYTVGNPHNCSGTTQFPGGNGCNGEAYTFAPLSATISNTTQATVPTNTINIFSTQWLDEVYNILYDDNGNLTGTQLRLDNFLGNGPNFPPDSCIDPGSISSPLDSTFEIVNCFDLSNGTITPQPALNFNTTGRPLYFKTFGGPGADAIVLDQDVNMNNVDGLCFERPRVLNFDHNRLITGLNIIDDMLFWTDNYSEPKKINITRSILGTDQSGDIHTAVINTDQGISLPNNYQPIQEEHISVIRKNPKNILNVEIDTGRDPLLNYSGVTNTVLSNQGLSSSIISSSNSAVSDDFSALQVGDNLRIQIETDVSGSSSFEVAWAVGDYLILKEFTNTISDPVPLANWTIRGLIRQWNNQNFNSNNGDVKVEIEIVSVKGTPPSPDPSTPTLPLSYTVDLEDKYDAIFEDKFPRFSYRYKYLDGEYSTFAPFTEVVFSPGNFNYDPKRGWNTGMVNNTKSIKLKDFVPTQMNQPIGQDIVSVDILYKEDTSPNVYIVETISPIDKYPTGVISPWNLNEYEINSETIKSTVPSNQLLRLWDNVPKKALAQETTGNRIVYANYEQGYDLKVSGQNYKPDFTSYLSIWGDVIDGAPKKSIKSLRDYKLGVVFTDEYGRETPILISESGGFKVEKKYSERSNRLAVKLNGATPDEAVYFKFYIKETSSEYYNLPMDRWYEAEDGNIWLAFPSSDRNKVDLDTSLYFKKGDDETVLENTTRYKVLAIENEAPEFIKTRNIRIGSSTHDQNQDLGNGVFAYLFGAPGAELENAPAIGGISFDMDYVKGKFPSTSISNMDEITEPLYVEFRLSGDRSARYLIAEITADRKDDTGADQQPTKYFVTLDSPFQEDIAFIFDDPVLPSKINPGTKIEFYKSIVENLPKYEGRFFAKVENDGKIKTQATSSSLGVNYIEKASKTVYVLDDDDTLRTRSEYASIHPSGGNMVTKDFSSYVDSNANNPSGINWNYLNARQSYFNDFDYFKPELGTGVFGTPILPHIMMLKSPELGTANSGGVWFIDRSTKKYGRHNDSLIWLENNNMNMFFPQANLISGHTATTNLGNGIVTPSPNYSNINIAFGGFGAWAYDKLHAHSGQFHINATNNTIDNFFSIGVDNPFHNSTDDQNFVSRLQSGFSFKWREDPTETLYTITGSTGYSQQLRFARNDDGNGFNTKDLIGADSSYHKTFNFSVNPAVQDWDPAGPVGTYMTNGLNLGSGEKDPSGNFLEVETSSTTAVSSTTIECVSIDGVEVGMSVVDTTYYSGADLLAVVVSIDPSVPSIEMSDAPTTQIPSGTDLKFGHTIRVVSEHVYGAPGNTTDPTDNYIIVDNRSASCNLNSSKSVYALHEGMMLDQYNLDATAGVNTPTYMNVIIKSFETGPPNPNGGNYTKINLTGYYYTLHYQDDAIVGDVDSTAWTVGSRIRFRQVTMNGASNYTERNVNNFSSDAGNVHGGIGAVGYDMVFVDTIEEYSDGGVLPPNPFIWETEPKEDTGLDVYYEISENNPMQLGPNTINTAIPVGSIVESPGDDGGFSNLLVDNTVIQNNISPNGDVIIISELIWMGPGTTIGNNGQTVYPIEPGSILQVTKPNGMMFEIEVAEVFPVSTAQPNLTREIRLNTLLNNSNYYLNWYNCYSFGNGVESNRIKDGFNLPFITNGVKVSTTSDEEYKQERRKYGLIYSGIYNSTSGINNLNQFIQAEKITKDINPIYGSIQKLHSGWGQSGDLLTLCEDRVLKILANKDALFNADGNTNVTATNKVLGTATPYSGEFGISKNPESFAHKGYRAYFTDVVRGSVMRLSMDGLTPISYAGMKDWFKDNLKLSADFNSNVTIVGSYDDKKDHYNVHLKAIPRITPSGPDYAAQPINTTVTYREDVKGWVSFKSFVPENAMSCGNEYFSFNEGNLWRHHETTSPRNTFYNVHAPSSVNVIMNDMPSSIKTFHTLNYEGSQSKVDDLESSAGVPDNYDTWDHTTWDGTFTNGVPNYGVVTNTIPDSDYYNITPGGTIGWYVDTIETDKEVGTLNEFIEKEGKWFNYIKGKSWQ